ncbi:hypothetical protein Tmar_1168 [Thermaerobacter marianensis DSM 12885]|uniref:CNNM transmembrane domain-containing protein n=1 Tax=Thermaerobacter marianensis (strain ATCC 700841 / DSM 12885 / JCM 10246 / 7p75a) TaxID=644966 RepID=E6SKS3_THEM7|nr:hypothetical protein [Thermaerobacter marianensis]ADU51281.1 hypothetical protein Tmar_1168 [Thermaerobacter marianensis DSM 12885]
MARGQASRYTPGWKRGVGLGFLTFAVALFTSPLSESAVRALNLPLAVLIVAAIIALGVVFDIIGVAAAAADEAPFHAMAAKRKAGARAALGLVRNADRVAAFANDVVGDVAGTLSGAAGAAVALRLGQWLDGRGTHLVVAPVVLALVAGLMVGAKAAGKGFALREHRRVLLALGRLLEAIERWTRLRLYPAPRRSRRRARVPAGRRSTRAVAQPAAGGAAPSAAGGATQPARDASRPAAPSRSVPARTVPKG